LQKIFLIALFFFNCFKYTSSFSQSHEVKGRVQSYSEKSVAFASLILLDSSNEILANTYSNENGEFMLKNVRLNFRLVISALSYERDTIRLNIGHITSKNLIIRLKEKPLELNEVIVESRKPITVKKDTIVFDAVSFSEGNEEVVEDLLRKIPGLNIDEKGTIKVGNKEVEKVMVEGDDFFEKGYKLLTKNMPSQPIDQIELLQNYSANPLLKDIEESEKVALNLKLTEDAKSQWFANVNAGYGLDNRHTFTGNVFNFSRKTKYYFLSNLNNLGYEATGEINHLINPYRPDDLTVIGDNENAAQFIDLTTIELDFKKSRTNFNNDKIISANAIFNPSDGIKIKTLGFLNRDERSFFQNTAEEFRTTNTEFNNTEINRWNKDNFNGFGKVDLKYNIKPNQILETSTSFNRSSGETLNRLIFNESNSLESLNTENTRFDQQFSLTTKLKSTHVFLLKGRYINETKPEDYYINQFFFTDLFSGVENADHIRQSNKINLQYGGFEAHLLNRKENSDLFEIKAGNQLRIDQLHSSFSILDSSDALIRQPSGYQNRTSYLVNDSYFATKYLKSMSQVSLIGKLDFHYIYNQKESFDSNNSQNIFYINPSIGLMWKPNDKHKINSTYSFTTRNAGVLDIYDNWVLTGFRFFNRGIGSFNQLNSSTVFLNYQYGGWSDNFLVNTMLLYSRNHDFFSTSTVLAQNYVQSEKALFKDREVLNVTSNIDRFIPIISSNLKLSLGYSQTTYKNIVNDVLRKVNSKHYSLGFELRSAFLGFFNYHLGSKWSTNLIQTTSSNSFTNNMTFVDILFTLSDKSNIQIQSERYFFGNTRADNNYYFLDIDWKYVIKPNKLTLTLSGRNLLDADSFRTASITDISALTTEYNLLPRYVLLKAEYRL